MKGKGLNEKGQINIIIVLYKLIKDTLDHQKNNLKGDFQKQKYKWRPKDLNQLVEEMIEYELKIVNKTIKYFQQVTKVIQVQQFLKLAEDLRI